MVRRYKAHRLYHLPCLPGDWYTYTLHGRTESKDVNKYGQVFANNAYFDAIYPKNTNNKVGAALHVFCEEFGVPERLTMDGSTHQVE